MINTINEWIKSRISSIIDISIILSILLIVCGLIMSHNCPANGWEISIINSTPFIFWLSIIIGFSLGTFILILACYNKLSNKYCYLGWFILSLSSISLMSLQIIRGYFISCVQGDVAYHLSHLSNILVTGNVDLNYPYTYILTIFLNYCGNISLTQLIQYVPVYFNIIMIIGFYLLTKIVSKSSKIATLSTILLLYLPFTSSVYMASWSFSCYIPYLSALKYLPFILFLIYFLISDKKDDVSKKIICIICIMILPLLHQLLSVVVFLFILIFIIYLIIIKKIMKTNIGSDIRNLLFILISGVSSLILVISISGYYDFIKSKIIGVLSSITNHVSVSTITSASVSTITPAAVPAITHAAVPTITPVAVPTINPAAVSSTIESGHIDSYLTILSNFNLLEISEVFIRQNGLLILLSFIFIFFLLILFKKKCSIKVMLIHPLCPIILLLPMICVLLLLPLFINLNYNIGRIFPIITIIMIILSGFVLYYLITHLGLSKQKIKKILIMVIIILIIFSYMFVGIISYYQSEESFMYNNVQTHSEFIGMDFMFKHINTKFDYISLGLINPILWSQALYGVNNVDNPSGTFHTINYSNSIISDHFGYDKYNKLGYTHRDSYLALSMNSLKYYFNSVLWKNRISKYEKNDYLMLNMDDTVNKLYMNEDIILYNIRQ